MNKHQFNKLFPIILHNLSQKEITILSTRNAASIDQIIELIEQCCLINNIPYSFDDFHKRRLNIYDLKISFSNIDHSHKHNNKFIIIGTDNTVPEFTANVLNDLLMYIKLNEN